MLFNFSVTQLDYKNRIRNLDAYAHGAIKSKKNFPVFLVEGKEVIFKPLSKTKPFTTPYFSYSEVFWSTIIHDYFDSSAPIYRLAICTNYEEEFITKYHHGTIVDSIEKSNCNLISLYELFLKHEEESVNIKDYINFCERFYNYINILDSHIMNDKRNLGAHLSYQILLSILRLDQNYHYENPLFYEKDNQIISIAPPIDHEFSTMFMYLDNFNRHKETYEEALKNLLWEKEMKQIKESCDIIELLKYEAFAIIPQNIEKIVQKYPYVAREFLKKLEHLINDLEKTKFIFIDNNYITPFNSDNFRIGHARYKTKDEQNALLLEQSLPQFKPDINIISDIIFGETLNVCHALKKVLEKKVN